ncbi:prolipoprotein diacylglyceryl transferase [Candidatus Sumerlaeota bacterium]|nr:prolipoprotein diacylglyceryl transferase [Candidatus Sumerlaeota bacterium]
MYPILFHIGGFIVPTYGLMIMIGAILCVWVALRRAPQVGVSQDAIYDLAFVALISGFVGARLLFIIVEFYNFPGTPLEFLKQLPSFIFSRSGFIFLGGLGGAIPAVLYYIRRNNLPMWDIGDIGGPSVALAHAFGRIGCFLAGCCYGGVCPKDSPLSFLAIRFPAVRDAKGVLQFSWAYQDHLERGLIDKSSEFSAAVYPSQLFESAANFLIFAALMLLWRRRKFSGEIFASYLMIYGATRFSLEFLRGDTDRGIYFGFSTSQWLSAVLITAGIIIWNVMRTRVPVTRRRTEKKKARAA